MDDEKEYDQKMLDVISKKTYPHSTKPTGEASMAREIIRLREELENQQEKTALLQGSLDGAEQENRRLREANERLHEKLGETIDECSALRHKLNKALSD